MMSIVRFAATSSPEVEESDRPEGPDSRERVLNLKRKLEEASGEIESLQSTLATQRELEQLLKIGRTHLQELRGRLQQTILERDAFRAELNGARQAHQHDVEQLQRELEGVRDELQRTSAERTALAASLDEQDAAGRRLAEEWADERNTFARLLNEATFNQREMTTELEAQRRQIAGLRESAARAQSLAQEIIRAHDPE